MILDAISAAVVGVLAILFGTLAMMDNFASRSERRAGATVAVLLALAAIRLLTHAMGVA